MPKSRDRAKRSHTLRTAEGSDKWGRRTVGSNIANLSFALAIVVEPQLDYGERVINRSRLIGRFPKTDGAVGGEAGVTVVATIAVTLPGRGQAPSGST